VQANGQFKYCVLPYTRNVSNLEAKMGMITPGVFDTWHVMTDHYRAEVLRDIIRWCKDNVALNDPAVSYHCRKYSFTYERFPRHTNFVFDREADALIFALKWA